MKPLPVELRSEVLAACDANNGTKAVALRFGVSEAWVRRIKQQRRETGQIAPKTRGPSQPKWRVWAEWLLTKISDRPDIYLRELQAELKAERGVEVSLSTLCYVCRELDQSRKKRR